MQENMQQPGSTKYYSAAQGIIYNADNADVDGDKGKGKRMGYDARQGAEAPFGKFENGDDRYGGRNPHLNRDRKDIATKVTSASFEASGMHPQRDQVVKHVEHREAPFGQYNVTSDERFGDKVYHKKEKAGEISGKINTVGDFDSSFYQDQLESKAKAQAAGRRQAAGSGIFGA